MLPSAAVSRGAAAAIFARFAASQTSFERAVYGGSADEGPTTDDYAAALRGARPSVDAAVRASFEADVRELARS